MSDTEFLVADINYHDERGRPKADIVSLLRALEWMREMQVQIVIIGFGDTQHALAKQVIADLTSRGTTVIVLAPPPSGWGWFWAKPVTPTGPRAPDVGLRADRRRDIAARTQPKR